MLLIWAPKDGERKEYQFVPGKLRCVEAEAIEAVGGGAWENFEEFGRAFMSGKRRALRAALWVVRRRDESDLTFESLEDLGPFEIGVDPFGEDERAAIRDRLVAGQITDEAERAFCVALLGEDPAAGPFEGAASPSDSPPAMPRSRRSAASTSGRSRSTSTAPRRSKTAGT